MPPLGRHFGELFAMVLAPKDKKKEHALKKDWKYSMNRQNTIHITKAILCLITFTSMFNCTNHRMITTNAYLTNYTKAVVDIYNLVSNQLNNNWVASIYREGLIIVKSKQKHIYKFSNKLELNRELYIYLHLFKQYDTKEICAKITIENEILNQMKEVFTKLFPGCVFDDYKDKKLSIRNPNDSVLIVKYNNLVSELWVNKTAIKRMYIGDISIDIGSEPTTDFGYADDFPEMETLIKNISSLFNKYDINYCQNVIQKN
jgi:hypothetical protein